MSSSREEDDSETVSWHHICRGIQGLLQAWNFSMSLRQVSLPPISSTNIKYKFHFLKFPLFPCEKLMLSHTNIETEIKLVLTDIFLRILSFQNQLGCRTHPWAIPQEKLCIHSEMLQNSPKAPWQNGAWERPWKKKDYNSASIETTCYKST